MIEINAKSVIDGLSAIIAEYGEDFVYETNAAGFCVYVNQGQPDCIVGRYLASVGVSLDRLTMADTAQHGMGESANDLLRKLEEEGVLEANDAATSLLTRVQYRQDEGIPWGEALDRSAAEVLGD